MRKLVVLFAGVIIPAILTAQLMQQWVGIHSGPCAWTTDDFGQRAACDADGNVYVCWGGRGPTGSTDYITVKYSSDGTTCWTRYYDGPDGGSDEANAIAVDASGVYVTGFCTDPHYDNDYATIKYDLGGNLLWHSHYDGECGSDVARAIAVSGNAVYVTGCSSGSGTCDDYATIKYDASTGSPLWSGTGIDRYGAARYDGEHGYDEASAIAVDASGAVYVTGKSTGSDWMSCYATVKYNTDGTLGWGSLPGGAACYDGGYGSAYASAIAVDATSGAVYVTGTSASSGECDNDWATIKYNASTGEAYWSRRYEESGNAFANAIAVDASGAVYVTGSSSGECTDYTTIRYDADGSEGWASPARYDGPDHFYDDAYAITVNNSGVYVTGFSGGSSADDDYATVWYDADNGTELGAARYAGPNGSYDLSLSIASGPAGQVYVTGYSTDYDQFENIVTIGYIGKRQSGMPAAFNLTDPADAATDVPIEGNLTWEASTGAERYEVSLGGIVYQAATNSYHYSGLSYSTEYSWNVTAFNNGGHTFSSNGPFSFSTVIEAPAAFDLKSPLNAATAQELNGTLSWNAAARATNYDVYFGLDDPPTSIVSTDQIDLHFDYSSLACNTTYYWKVAAKNAGGSTSSDVWHFTTGTLDAGVSAIIEPQGVIDTLKETPEATICNFGTLACDVTVWFEIIDSTGGLAYTQSVAVTGLAGGGEYDAVFPDWDVPGNYEGWYFAKCYTTLAGDINATNDTARSQFAVEATQKGPTAWVRSSDAPGGAPHGDIGAGAAMATDPDGLYAFVLKGSKTRDFYRYEPEAGIWAVLDPIPEKGRDRKKRNVEAGGTLAQVNGKFYCTKGGNSLDFWEYNPAAQPGSRWTQMADVPAGAAGVQAGASSAGLTVNGGGFVYLLKASGTFEFYRYNVANNTWQTMATAPGQRGEEFGQGSSISCDGTDTIFALKGTLDKFYAYVVSTNTWLTRSDLPLGLQGKQAKAGAAICYHMRRVYTLKGGNTQEFWTYNCDDNTWTQGFDVPLGPKKTRVQDGGALVYCRDSRYLFATKGNCLEFWSYGKLSNYEPQSPDGVAAVQMAGVNTYGLATASALAPGRDRVFFALPRPGTVSLKLYDMTGRVARVLINGWQQAGRHEIALGAADLAQGAYVVRFAAGDYIESRKLIIQR